MAIGKIKSVSQFISAIETRATEPRRIYLYRGQCDKYLLLPGIARPKFSFTYSKLETERRILDEFKAHSLPFLKIVPTTDLEYLIIAQHYGLPTRLLDWTENALAALYFAVSNLPGEEMEPEVKVCSFLHNDDVIVRDYTIEIFEQTEIKFLKPNALVDRITSQSGWFSMHPQQGRNSGFYLQGDKITNDDVKFSTIKIDPMCVKDIYKTLNDCGINRFSIFKDLDGLGAYLTSKYQGFRK